MEDRGLSPLREYKDVARAAWGGPEAVGGKADSLELEPADHSLNVVLLRRLDNQHEKCLLCSKSLRRYLGTDPKALGKPGFLLGSLAELDL